MATSEGKIETTTAGEQQDSNTVDGLTKLAKKNAAAMAGGGSERSTTRER